MLGFGHTYKMGVEIDRVGIQYSQKTAQNHTKVKECKTPRCRHHLDIEAFTHPLTCHLPDTVLRIDREADQARREHRL